MKLSKSRWLLRLALAFVLVLARGSTVYAQSCHAPSLRDRETASYRASATASFASYTNSSYAGEYQGVQVAAAFMHPRVWVDVALPSYRLVRNGLSTHGLGDLAADTRVVAYQTPDRSLSVGPELALTLPTGDDDKGLGMGHVMLMPGAWLMLHLEKLSLIAQLAYGRAAISLSASGHRHGGGYTPLVNPMNMQELEHALSLGYAVHPNLQLEARVLGAQPIDSALGRAREVVACGLRLYAGPVDVGFEVQVPVVGSPFRARTLLSVGAQL
jgi:hypothetical protein